MKMKHVMAALLFGVVAVGSVQAQETHYKYYPVTTEIYGEVIINTTDLDEACRLGVDSYNERWIQIYSKTNQVGHGKYKQRWLDDFKNGRPIRYIMCAYQKREKNKDGSWGEWEDRSPSSFVNFSCRDGGRFLFRTKDLCAEERRGPIPEESKCDPSYYPNGIVPEDCPKNKPEIDPVTGYPKNDALCDGKDYGEDAGVACHGGIRKPCFWAKREDLEKAFPNKIARDINYQCVMEHEQFHADDHQGAICKENGRLGGITEYHQHRREADAYVKSEECFRRERTQCGDDPVCKKIIEGKDGRINHSKSWKDFHNNAIGR